MGVVGVVGVVARGPGPEMRFATKFRCDCFLFTSPSPLLRSLVRLVFGSVLLIFSFSLLLLCDCNRVLSVLVVVVVSTVSLSFVGFFGQQPAHFRTQHPPLSLPPLLPPRLP